MFNSNNRVISAPAKVNLFLEVGGTRDDGYHELMSVVTPVSLADDVEFEPTDGEVVTIVESDGIPLGDITGLGNSDSNLATRAALALKEVAGRSDGVRITIRKRIPIGGGLGGGSGNAAAVLRGLERLWNTGISEEKLLELAAGLGCDVPAMLCGRPVKMEGRGELVYPIDLAPEKDQAGWWLVLVNPGFSVCTRDIYMRYTSLLTSPAGAYKSMVSAVMQGDPEAAAKNLFNSLEGVVYGKYPLLGILAERLRDAGSLGVLLCGSGSSLFGIARDEKHARDIEQEFRSMEDCAVWCSTARTLPDSVMAAHGPLKA